MIGKPIIRIVSIAVLIVAGIIRLGYSTQAAFEQPEKRQFVVNAGEVENRAGAAYLVKDIYPGDDSNPGQLTDVDGTLFFVSNDGIHGDELWKSNGEEAGTVMVKDIKSSYSSLPSDLTNVNGTLFFRATDDENGTELWKSDGTEQGTLMVKDINPHGSSDPSGLININGLLFFAADDGINGTELWKSDGTPAGTEMVKDIYISGSSNSAHWYNTDLNGILFFRAYDGVHGNELWKSDGTSAGTVMLKDINPGPGDSMGMYQFVAAVEDTLYFWADDGSYGHGLWKSDGTNTGTVLVKEGIWADCFNGCFTSSLGDKFYFSLGHGPGDYTWDLWESDGTSAGTKIVKDFTPTSLSQHAQISQMNEIFFFSVDDGVYGIELWVSDGTQQGTTLVKDINPNASSRPLGFVNVPGGIYFSADDGTHGAELWKSDGTESGTQMVMDLRISPEGTGSAPSGLTVSGSRLFFEANEGIHGYELWAIPFVPLTGLSISGDSQGEVGLEYSFTAEINPSDAATPVTYEWQATGQSGETNVGGNSDTASFTWYTAGEKTVSVVASNTVSSVESEMTILISEEDIALGTLILSGDEKDIIGSECEFTADISPLDATTPITYKWLATGQAGVTHSGGVSDTVLFVWDTPGTKTVSVTADNGVNELSEQVQIEIREELMEIFIPIVMSK